MSIKRNLSPNMTGHYKLYLVYLNKYPLLTKSVTASVLAGLNEVIANVIARDVTKQKVRIYNKTLNVYNLINSKSVLMALYGFFIGAPFSHYSYNVLNKLYPAPLSKKLKIAQLLTSLGTITPVISAIFLSFLSVINYGQFDLKNDLKLELKKLMGFIKNNLKGNLWRMIKSSAITSTVSMTIAQNFIDPQLWVVFFNVIYFVLGTYQNTMVKLKSKK